MTGTWGSNPRNSIRTAPRRPLSSPAAKKNYFFSPAGRLSPFRAAPKLPGAMKLQIKQAGSSEELTVQSQKEFLLLYQRGVIAFDDLVLRGERWVRVGELPWIRGMSVERRRDNKRLLWIVVAMMILGLIGVVFIQTHAGVVARKTGALPPGAVRAVPAR